MSFHDMLAQINACGTAALNIRDYLEDQGISGLPSHDDMRCQAMSDCFLIHTNGSDRRFDAIAVSVPPGSQYGRDNNGIVANPVTQIALIKNTKLVYVDELGYDDVRMFSDFESLLEEVKRLLSLD